MPFRQSKELREHGETGAKRHSRDQKEEIKIRGNTQQRIAAHRHKECEEQRNRAWRTVEPAPERGTNDHPAQRVNGEKSTERKCTQASLVDHAESQVRTADGVPKSTEQTNSD